MNNISAIKPKHPKLEEVNAVRAARGLDAIEDLHSMFESEFELSPFLTLQDLASGSAVVQKIVREQQKYIGGIAAARREAKKNKASNVSAVQRKAA